MTQALAVVVPAHQEQALIARCLTSIARAAHHPYLAHLPVQIVIVLDACHDRTPYVVQATASRMRQRRTKLIGLTALEVAHANVGLARAAGCRAARRVLSGLPPRELWIATTDADSVVPVDWLAHQVRLHRTGVEGWAGTIRVDDWSQQPPSTPRRFRRLYGCSQTRAPTHAHVHGANLGFTAQAYQDIGGFAAFLSGEDHALFGALGRSGFRLAATTAAPVTTSARREGRAPNGFSQYLRRLPAGKSPAPGVV